MSLPIVFIHWSVICDCCISSSYQLVFSLFHNDGFSYTYRYNPFCALRGHRSGQNFNVLVFLKVSKGAKIRNQYHQVPHLT